MKKLYIAANFKSHKTRTDMEQWMDVFDAEYEKKELDDKLVILAPAMPSLMFVSNRLLSYTDSFALSVQDLSPYPSGAYTGAVSTENLEGFNVDYAIIGHSERRTLFGETEENISKKCQEALLDAITPLLCVQNAETPIPQGVTIVAYEPVTAIGTGHADTPEDANNVAKKLKERGVHTALYGGSVTSENVHTFTSLESLDGVLVGGACLDPHEFIRLIQNA